MSVILWVSAVEGCPLSRVPLYIISVPYTVSDTLSVDFKKKQTLNLRNYMETFLRFMHAI